MATCAVIQEQLRLFADVAILYQVENMALDESALANPLQALAQFVFGYAFERQGRSPAYAPVARDVVEIVGREAGFWESADSPCKVWDSFHASLPEGSAPNPKNNPLCYKGYSYKTKHGRAETSQHSIVQFIQSNLKDYNYNLLRWSKHEIEQRHVRKAHNDLVSINGIGPKIASFFLRDVAWHFGIQVTTDRVLLQPVDVWVQRIIRCDTTGHLRVHLVSKNRHNIVYK